MSDVEHVDGCSQNGRCDCDERDLYETRTQYAVANGDSTMILKTMRTILAERFDRATPRESAAIAGKIKDLTDKITELEGKTNVKPDPAKQTALSWAQRIAGTANLS